MSSTRSKTLRRPRSQKMFCSFDATNKVDRVGVSAHNPGTVAGVTARTFKLICAGKEKWQQSTENRDHKAIKRTDKLNADLSFHYEVITSQNKQRCTHTEKGPLPPLRKCCSQQHAPQFVFSFKLLLQSGTSVAFLVFHRHQLYAD